MSKLKEKLELGDKEIPACVKEQIMKFYLIALATFVIGVMLTVVAFGWFILLATFILALIMAGMGYYRALEITHHGYREIDGVCTRIEYTLPSRVGGKITKDIPKRYLITQEHQTYAIPYFKQNPTISEGDRVLLYLKSEPDTFEWNGIHTPSVIYGYEVVYSENKEESEND